MIEIIKRPAVTEKAMKFNAMNQYVFIVDPNANKIQIKQAIEAMFEVNVVSVRTVRTKGKVKSRLTKKGLMRGRTALVKKAYISLKPGQTIDVVSGAAGNE